MGVIIVICLRVKVPFQGIARIWNCIQFFASGHSTEQTQRNETVFGSVEIRGSPAVRVTQRVNHLFLSSWPHFPGRFNTLFQIPKWNDVTNARFCTILNFRFRPPRAGWAGSTVGGFQGIFDFRKKEALWVAHTQTNFRNVFPGTFRCS